MTTKVFKKIRSSVDLKDSAAVVVVVDRLPCGSQKVGNAKQTNLMRNRLYLFIK